MNLPSQQGYFTGYWYHKAELSYGELWQSFIEVQKQSAEHFEKHINKPGQYQSINQSWYNRESEKQLNERENEY